MKMLENVGCLSYCQFYNGTLYSSVWEYSLVKNNNNQQSYIVKTKTKMEKFSFNRYFSYTL